MVSLFSRGWYNLKIIMLRCYFDCYFKLYYITGVSPSLKTSMYYIFKNFIFSAFEWRLAENMFFFCGTTAQIGLKPPHC